MNAEKSFFDFNIETLGGKPLPLQEYKNRVVLVVNTASQCGYTGQYSGLEKLYQEYKDKGFVIIGFPANDFGAQEPGTNEEIATFCKRNYGVSFPMSSKVVVKGSQKLPLFSYLTENAPTKGEIKWNFEKFLIAKDGKVIGRYPSGTKPNDATLVGDIQKAL